VKHSSLRNFATAFALVGALAAGVAQAQDYPTRTIRILTPYDVGSMVDSTTRMVADELQKKLGQPVIVENRAGAMGLVASNALLNAPADGYTLMTDTPASAINPSLNPAAKYNAKSDIAPVAQFMKLPFVVAVSPELKVRTAAELVALARKQPGAINVAVAGTSTGLVGDLFAQASGVRFTNVPYKGAVAATMAVLKNEAQVVFLDVANLSQHIQAGKLVGLLVTSDERSPVIKDVPTAKEAGFASFDPSTWFGVFAKAGVPQAVQDKINGAIREVMASPRMQEYLKARGATFSTMTAPEFNTFFDREVDRWSQVVKSADAKPAN
jgi:tripartite-type tricarboxylate transporter receptor subunit TctC